MDELIAFVRSLLLSDPVITTLFTAAGRPQVIVRASGGAADAVYPVIIIDALPGGDVAQGESYARFSEGNLKLYAIARYSDVCSSPLQLLWNVTNRINDLLRGSRAAGLMPLQGRIIGPHYKCTVCRSTIPSGPVSDPDPEVARFTLTYKISLLRTA